MENHDAKRSRLYRTMFQEYPDVVNVEQLCKMLRCGKKNAYELLKTEKIKAFRVGHIYKIPKSHIIDFAMGFKAD